MHMCIRSQYIKTVGCTHPVQQFIPCGKCYDCRKRDQNSWLFRLKAEISALDPAKWYGAFVTLTYNDKSLPYIPRQLVKDDAPSDMCFSKVHARKFIELVRKYCESFGAVYDKAIKYMFCSEFGEHTQRSHYHALFIVPSFVNPLGLFEFVKKNWQEYGFVFPKDFQGGEDGHGYIHKPFVVESLEKAAHYVSKYISKDIAYMSKIDLRRYRRSITLRNAGKYEKRFYRYRGLLYEKLVLRDGKEVKKDEKIKLTDYLPFHLQSRCLGISYVEDLKKKGDSSILEKIADGEFFVGELFARQLPRYILNKLLFKVRYGKKRSKRVVRYYHSNFLKQNSQKVFACKVTKLVKRLEPYARFTKMNLEKMCTSVLAYYGVSRLFRDADPVVSWLNRYRVDTYFEDGIEKFCRLDINNITDEQNAIVDVYNREYARLMKLVDADELHLASIKQTSSRLVNYIIDSFRSGE